MMDQVLLREYTIYNNKSKYASYTTLYNNFLYVACKKSVKAVDLKSNLTTWETTINSKILEAIFVLDQYIITHDYYILYILDSLSGVIISEYKIGAPNFTVKVSGNFIIMCSWHNDIYFRFHCFKIIEGNLKLVSTIDRHISMVSYDNMFACCEDGKMTIYDLSHNIIRQFTIPNNFNGYIIKYYDGLFYIHMYNSFGDERVISVYSITGQLIESYLINFTVNDYIIFNNHIFIANDEYLYICKDNKFIRKIKKTIETMEIINNRLYFTSIDSSIDNGFTEQITIYELYEYFWQDADKLDTTSFNLIKNWNVVNKRTGIHKDIGLLFCRALLV